MINTSNPAALEAALTGDTMNALIASTPGGIERSEKRGQEALVASTNMPLELSPSREAFEQVGFTFGDKIDDVFQKATLPVGWTRGATDHSMHSDILDQHGRKRVSVFYKAAFYDRRADANLTRRYQNTMVFSNRAGFEKMSTGQCVQVVLDVATDTILWRSEVLEPGDYKAGRAARESAQAWLVEHFPQADDPTSYWTEQSKGAIRK